MNVYHKIDKVNIQDGILSLLVDGQLVKRVLSDISPRLAKANDQEINHYQIAASGYGIHWPLIDEDISIDGLLGIYHTPAQLKRTA